MGAVQSWAPAMTASPAHHSPSQPCWWLDSRARRRDRHRGAPRRRGAAGIRSHERIGGRGAIGTGEDPRTPRRAVDRALTALVVCHVRSAVVAFCNVAVKVAVGAAGGATVTVCALRGGGAAGARGHERERGRGGNRDRRGSAERGHGRAIDRRAHGIGGLPRDEAVVGFCKVAVIVAVGAGGAGPDRLMVASFDGGPSSAAAL